MTVCIVYLFEPVHIAGYKDNITLFVSEHKLAYTLKISPSVIDVCKRIYQVRERKLIVCVSQKIFYAEVFKRLVYRFHQSLNIVEAAGIYKKIVCNGGIIAYDMLLKMQRAEHNGIISFDKIVEIGQYLLCRIIYIIAVIAPRPYDVCGHIFGKNAVIRFWYDG